MNKSKIILISILSFIFISLIVLIKLNLINSVDTFIYNLVTVNMNNSLTSINKVFTFLGSTLFIVSLTIVLFVIFIILKKKNTAFILSASIIISTIINNLVKIIICRERPEVLSLVTENTYSFPSGHSMAAVTLYGMLIYIVNKSNLNKKLKITFSILLCLLPLLVMISRIYLGAHFASDVIGACILSVILLLIETGIVERYNLI